MHDEDIRSIVLNTVETILPGVGTMQIRGDESLRAQVDLDSMDWLNVITALGDRFELRIPERDYGKLLTLDDIVAYLSEMRAAKPTR
ncbi:MAG TPA: phosphopantetheine-binding protein [Rhodocyclaceae bacterium]|nr:phosphopantetheine-binding protein [Rhodocyclaceae bacterium]HRQ46479.1 phosphopantetheine-binding protein [Rhodocyclaceae bacterium]